MYNNIADHIRYTKLKGNRDICLVYNVFILSDGYTDQITCKMKHNNIVSDIALISLNLYSFLGTFELLVRWLQSAMVTD